MTIGPEAQAALDEVLTREDPTIIGVVLSGSAARTGMATERSDVDVFVVRTEEAAEGRTTSRSRYVDEIPQTLADLEDVPLWGGDEYGYRWGYCYTQVLRDETGGRIPAALRRMETHTVAEARRRGRPSWPSCAGASGAGTWPAGAPRRPPTRSRRGWTARTGSA